MEVEKAVRPQCRPAARKGRDVREGWGGRVSEGRTVPRIFQLEKVVY